MERSRNVEDLHHLRLMALLHELVRERELKGAAEALGLDPRTLSASMDRGALSGLVQVALERWLLAEGDREAARCRDEVRELAGRVDGLEQRVGELVANVGKAVEDVGKVTEATDHGGETAQDLRRLERRMDRLESGGRGGDNTSASGSAGRHLHAPATERRRYSDLVTVGPAGDDEEVFGAAWPLVQEWRGLWAGPPGSGPWPALADDGSPHSGVGGRHAGGARADPAPGDGAAARAGAKRPARLAPPGVGRHPPETGPAPGAALAAKGDHPGAVVAVGPRAGGDCGVAPVQHHCRFFVAALG